MLIKTLTVYWLISGNCVAKWQYYNVSDEHLITCFLEEIILITIVKVVGTFQFVEFFYITQ